ncbi:MAG: hypothetical protein WKG07_50320 [Hymenobacter sp.]
MNLNQSLQAAGLQNQSLPCGLQTQRQRALIRTGLERRARWLISS